MFLSGSFRNWVMSGRKFLFIHHSRSQWEGEWESKSERVEAVFDIKSVMKYFHSRVKTSCKLLPPKHRTTFQLGTTCQLGHFNISTEICQLRHCRSNISIKKTQLRYINLDHSIVVSQLRYLNLDNSIMTSKLRYLKWDNWTKASKAQYCFRL